jgi:prepilin-type N-terminal cleavage/methylation domain-containing protein
MSARKNTSQSNHYTKIETRSVSHQRRLVSSRSLLLNACLRRHDGTGDGVVAGGCHSERKRRISFNHVSSFPSLRMAHSRGFSLVELSIVLVILGLLVGGVLTGKSLIRAAELRSVTTEMQNYQSAVQIFEDKYKELPGDMTNATELWGAADPTPATCLTTVGTGTQTCDGNGDGYYGFPSDGFQRGEMFMFWQHLANAQLISGSYNGMAGSNFAQSIINTNVPASKMSSAGWSFIDLGSAGHPDLYDLYYNRVLAFGGQTTDYFTHAPIISPDEAWKIDTKIDDGLPAKGLVIAIYWNNACAVANDGTHASDDFNASYNLSNTSILCSLIFTKDPLLQAYPPSE